MMCSVVLAWYLPMCIIRVPQFRAKRISRHSSAKVGATLGANSTIVCGVTIGEYAFVGAGAVINQDVPDYALMVGVPAKQIGWMSQHGERLSIPLEGNVKAECPVTGDLYILKNKKLSKLVR